MKDHISALFEKTEQYIKTTIVLYKLKLIEKSADVTSSFTANLTVAIFACLSILSLNLGAAYWIGSYLGNVYIGFFMVSGFYAIVTLILLVFKNKWIKKPLKNMLIQQNLN